MKRVPICVSADALQGHFDAMDERLYLEQQRQRHANAFERREKRQQRRWAEKSKPERTGERVGYVILS